MQQYKLKVIVPLVRDEFFKILNKHIGGVMIQAKGWLLMFLVIYYKDTMLKKGLSN